MNKCNDYGLYVPSESPHLMPFFTALREIWQGKCTYYYCSDRHDKERESYGWSKVHDVASVLVTDENREALELVPILHLTIRDIGLIERRLKRGLITIYTSERWFKPIMIHLFWRVNFSMPGVLRLLLPSYWHMARRFSKFFSNPNFYCLPFGVHSASDMARLCGLMLGEWRCLFREPALTFESVPCGHVTALSSRCLVNHMRLWGYFVSSGAGNCRTYNCADERLMLKVLWLGRLIGWKHPETILHASKMLANHSLQITFVGEGPEKERLVRLAKNMDNVTFLPFINKDIVRKKMREYDVFVMSSDAVEGWGAVTSEALEEGLYVLGTYEAGASATILPKDDLFHAGDWRAFGSKLLECARKKSDGSLHGQGIGEWSAVCASRRLADWLKTL